MNRNRRSLHRPSSPEAGLALALTMLILVALTLPALGLMVASHREMANVSTEVSRKMATFHADAVTVAGAKWLEGQNALGPPERVNLLGISDTEDDGYWAIRNFGEIGDSDSDTASNYPAIAPDDTHELGTPYAASSWYRVSSVPNSSQYVNRVPGEEAGTGVQNTFVVEGLSRHEISSVQVRVHYAQVYGNAGYE